MNALINTLKNYYTTHLKKSEPSILSGVVLIVATGIGAGMFSLPVIMAGAWYTWSAITLVITGIVMLLTGLMMIEVNTHFENNASFDTFSKTLLGNKWSIAVGISVAFVLYIITYAYLSGTSSILAKTLNELFISKFFGTTVESKKLQIICIIIVTFLVGFITSCSSNWVGRITIVLLFGKFIAFFMTFYGLVPHIELGKLFDTAGIGRENNTYFSYIFIIFPYCIVSYVYQSSVPSLVKHFNGNSTKVAKSVIYSVAFMIAFYVFWITVIMGNISRDDFGPIIEAGGQIDIFVSTLSNIIASQYMDIILIFFGNFAFAASLLAATLGLFDYIADLAKFDNSFKGRLKTSCLTYLPPAIVCAFYPTGFLHAIGAAGFFITFWSIILPPLLVKSARRSLPYPSYRAPINAIGLNAIIAIGLLVYIFMVLEFFGVLPTYK